MVGIIDSIKGIFNRPSAARPPLELETVVAAAVVTDPQGNKVDTADLEREIAGPSMGGVRSVLASSVSSGLDPIRLARILNAAVNGQPEDYYQLAEEMEEKWPQFQSTVKQRKLQVCQLDITIEAATDDSREQKDAELCREYVDRGDLELELFDMLDFSIGFSTTEMVWPEGTARLKAPWMPRLVTRFQRHFAFDQWDGETLRLKGGPNNDSAVPTDLEPYKFIVHRMAGKSGLTVRGGLARSAAWCYLFQNMALTDWVLCAQVYGMPIRIGKYDKNATEGDRRKLLNAVMNIAADAAAIIPDTMMVDFVEAMASATPEIYQSLCEYADQSISKLVLGQTATTDATAGGLGGSQGTVHDGVRERFQRADARALASTLKRDLFTALIDINHGPPPSGLYPKVRIGQAEEFTKEDLEIVEGLVNLGVQIEESVIRDRAGYADPPEKGRDGKPVRLLQPTKTSQPAPPAQNAAQGAQDGPSGVTAASAAPIASGAALNRLKTALKSDPASLRADQDAIDQGVADLRDQWQPVIAPIIDPIQEAFTAASSFEDLKDRLLNLPDAMRVEGIAELLARGQFSARLAGEAGIDLRGDKTDAS